MSFRATVRVAAAAIALSAAANVAAPAGAVPSRSGVHHPVNGGVLLSEWDGTARSPGWVRAENQRPGTEQWKLTSRSDVAFIEGYARTTSATPGTEVALYVNTAAATFVAEVYRMGWYGGDRGRLVWESGEVTGIRQSVPVRDRRTGLARADWTPSLTVPIGDDWLPGNYLVKLVSLGGDQTYVPLTVRDDSAVAQLLVLNAVTTWQAYNRWGGCSLYSCRGVKGLTRAVKVSFDRPYDRNVTRGAGQFLENELPLVAFAEEQGIDLAYATSIDLHQNPNIVTSVKGILSLGHDEYYSTAMRGALVNARSAGRNLAFFGANAVYRHIRLEPASDAVADRVVVNYRRRRLDPARFTQPSEVTLNWRAKGKPEAGLVGIQYACPLRSADLVVRDPSHWIWSGTGVVRGTRLRGLIGVEADALGWGTPSKLDLLSASPIRCGRRTVIARTSYYSTSAGAGVFATGTIRWICALDPTPCSAQSATATVRIATANVLAAFSAGPAGLTHPSAGRR